MLNKLLKRYKQIKSGGYLGGIKTIFDNIQILDSLIEDNPGKRLSILEVGSERDVGSTFYFARYCNQNNLKFITIDPDTDSHAAADKIVSKYHNPHLMAVKEKGEVYLDHYADNDVMLVYMDGFDVLFPETVPSQKRIDIYRQWGIDLLKDGNRISAEVHLETTRAIVDNVIKGGIIAFDDSYFENDQWYGKGATAIPFLMENGFQLISDRKRHRNHSILLQKQ